MALPDDPTKVALPQLKVPGMGSPPQVAAPPAAPAGTGTPMADLRNTMQQVANVTNAPAPAPAPLHGPDTGSTVLPVLKAADTAMRDAGGAIASGAQAVGNSVAPAVAAASAPLAPSTGSMSSNPDWASRLDPNAPSGVEQGLTALNQNVLRPVGAGMVAAGQAATQSTPYPKLEAAGPTVTNSAGEPYTPEKGWNPARAVAGFFQDTAAAARGDGNYADLRAARDANRSSYGSDSPTTPTVATTAKGEAAPPPRNWQDDYRVKAPEGAAPTAPAAPETPMLSGTGAARMIEMDNGQKLFTNVNSGADAVNGLTAANGVTYGMPAPGTAPAPAGNPNLGTAADNLRQLQNMRALSDMTPQGGYAALPDQAEQINAANDKRRAVDAATEGMSKAGTRTARAGYAAQLAALTNAGSQEKIAEGRNQVQSQGQNLQHSAALAGVNATLNGQNLTHNLGMRQVDATLNGQNLTHDAALQQVGATLTGQQVTADTAAKTSASHERIYAGNNAATIRAAEIGGAKALQAAELGRLSPGMIPYEGVIYQQGVDKATKATTMTPVQFPRGAPPPAKKKESGG